MVSPSPAIFVVGAIFAWRPGLAAIRRVFVKTSIAAGLLLVIVQSVYVLEAHQINGMTQVAIGLLVRALILEVLEALDRRTSAESFAVQ